MTNYVRVDGDNFVREIITLPSDVAPSAAFHPDVATKMHAFAGSAPAIGQVRNSDGTFVDPPAPALSKSELKSYAARVRYAREIGGIVVGGVQVRTDRESQQMVAGAKLAAQADEDFTTDWKGADGEWTTLNASQISAVADAVLAHVASCFAAERLVHGDIDSEDITTMAEIDAYEWPGA